MKRIVEISGMHCAHCSSRVENALNAIEGVKATVNLKKGVAVVKSKEDIPQSVIKQAIEELGFEVK